jgi:integrase
MAVAAYNIQWRSKPDAVGFRTARIKVKRGAKPHYKTVRVRTVREAHKIAAAFAADVDHGKAALAPARLLFSTFLDQWLAGLNVAPLTRINYTSAVNCHIKPALGSIALRSLSPLVIKQAFAGWVGKLKPSSLRQLRNVLASALKSAEKFDLISASPMRKLQGELPVGNPAKAVPVSADKITELLQDDTVYGVAVLLCVAAGLRRGEACGLQWRDIDFDLSTIRIERQLLPLLGPDGNELFGPPKSKYGVRTIRLPAKAMDRLRDHRRKVTEVLLRYGKRLAREMPVVCSDRGYPIDVKLLTAWAGRRGIKLHNLRHWHLSELVNSGRPLAEVAKIAGHSSAVITARIYLHAPEDEGKAAEIIGKAVF